jgi:flagellin-like protein
LTRKTAKSRRAISPILATLLLVVIAVAAIVVTYAWVMTYMTSIGNQAGVRMYEVGVNFYNVSGVDKIDVDVGNSGTSDTQIIGLYVGTSSSYMQDQNITALPLLAGNTQTITVDYNWTVGTSYYFKVVSSSGQVLSWTEPPVSP